MISYYGQISDAIRNMMTLQTQAGVWRMSTRAEWWPVSSWTTYLVWEKWPELFSPWTSGYITPNNKLNGW
jgi:carbohydrate-selective porin OprB